MPTSGWFCVTLTIDVQRQLTGPLYKHVKCNWGVSSNYKS